MTAAQKHPSAARTERKKSSKHPKGRNCEVGALAGLKYLKHLRGLELFKVHCTLEYSDAAACTPQKRSNMSVLVVLLPARVGVVGALFESKSAG